MDRRSVLLAGVSPASEVKLRTALQEAEFEVLPPGPLKRDLLREVSGVPAVVSLNGDVEGGFRLARDLNAAGMLVVVVGPNKDADLILRAMREGAKEYVVAGDEEALARALRELVKPSKSGSAGMIYAVFPAKGGVGATTVAANLAGALQAKGGRTCLIDLNLNMGDVLAFLDLAGGYSIADVILNMRRLDRELLDASLLRHRSGVHVLAQSHRIEQSDRVDPASLTSLLEFLRLHFNAIVLDGLRSFDEVSVAAVDASDQVLLLLTQEVPAVRDAKRCADLFRRLGAESKLKVVANRFAKGIEINEEVIADTVGLPVEATIANDYPSVVAAVNRGVLLHEGAPRAQVTRDIDALVKLVGYNAAPQETREKRSLFSRFFASRSEHAA